MSLKKFLRRLETTKREGIGQRCALGLITGTSKVAGFLLKASDRVGSGTQGQVLIEYLMLMVAIALFTIVFTTGSFFTSFRDNMDATTEFAMNTMEQPGMAEPATTTNGITIPWWEAEIEEGGVMGWGGGPVAW